MNDTRTSLDSSRMQALVAFTAASFQTDYPSPFGASIYDSQTGELVAQAYDTVLRECDPTNHAEMNAIRLASRKLGRLSLKGCVLYSTCEPCPMCMSACIWAELDAVNFGASTMEDANAYWPQRSDMRPQELLARVQFQSKCVLHEHIERPLCQALFKQCDQVRRQRNLGLPPHRNVIVGERT